MIDTHAHLQSERLDYRRIVDEMVNDGLEKIICVGYDLATSEMGVRIATDHENIFATVGIHPNSVSEAKNGDLEKIYRLSKNKKVVAIGEIGLDYFHKFSDRDTQKRFLLEQLDLAEASGLPIIFHLRDAYLDMQSIINQNKHKIKNGAVMHCFSGSIETARFYTDLGYYISFGGSVTFKNAAKDEIVKSIPIDRLLAETDCPWMSPEPFRSKVNEPKNVRLVINKLASILQMDFEETERITSENASRLFKI